MNNELVKRILTSIVLFFFSIYFIIKGSYFFNLFILLVFLLSFYEWYKLVNNKINLFIGLIFLIFSFLSAYVLRNIDLLIFLFVIFISILSDIGGYVFGKIFGGPKLTKISPNKTYSGSAGSFLFSIFGGLIYVFFFDILFIKFINFDTVKLIFVILFLSTINQIGDLIISYFKRINKIKNTGNILPGHGGLLDRIDGIIFVIPIFLLINKFL